MYSPDGNRFLMTNYKLNQRFELVRNPWSEYLPWINFYLLFRVPSSSTSSFKAKEKKLIPERNSNWLRFANARKLERRNNGFSSINHLFPYSSLCDLPPSRKKKLQWLYPREWSDQKMNWARPWEIQKYCVLSRQKYSQDNFVLVKYVSKMKTRYMGNNVRHFLATNVLHAVRFLIAPWLHLFMLVIIRVTTFS